MAKCKVCKDKFETRYFLQKTCLNPSCLASHMKKEREAKEDKKFKAKKKAFNDNDKKLRLREAQKAFNAFIRKRDEKLPCISCQKHREETAVSSGSNWHAGHYKTVGSMPELRFNELNCHRQCAHCNNFLSGNIEYYTPNLVKKIGQKDFDFITGHHEPVKYMCKDLKEIELFYKQKLKELL